jgi:hypothetical protein
MRLEVLTLKIWMLVFWVEMPCGQVDRSNVSEEHTAFIFRAEVTCPRGITTQKNSIDKCFSVYFEARNNYKLIITTFIEDSFA